MATYAQFIELGPFFYAGSLVTAPKLYHYVVGTTTDKDVWTDRAKDTTAAQPVVGDANGIVSCFADGLYKFVVKDSADNTLYTWDAVQVGVPDVSGVINVLDYGAIGDGVADDTTAMQEALTAAGVSGGAVYVPAGTYKVTATLTMGSDLLLFGAGRFVSRIKGNLTAALLQSPNTATRYYRWGIQDIGFDNTAKTNAGGIAVNLKNISHAYISNLDIQNVETAVRIDATGGGAYYNDCYSVAVSGVINGYVCVAGANENRWFGGRINDCTIGMDFDNLNSAHVFGTAIEVFTTGVRVGNSAVTQYVNLYGLRLENTPTSGTGFSLSANAQTTSIINPNWIGLTTNISDSGVDTFIVSGERGGTTRIARLKLSEAVYSTAVWAQLYAGSNGVITARNAVDSGYADMDMNDLTVRGKAYIGGTTSFIYSGTGTPEAVVSANKGSLFMRTDGGAGTCLYVKETTGGNTGWVAK